MDQKLTISHHTNGCSGRHAPVTPAHSTNRHLAYGRIILAYENPRVSFETGERETGLIVLSGATRSRRPGTAFRDVAVRRTVCAAGSKIEMEASGIADAGVDANVDIAEFSCEVEGTYPVQFVPYAELAKDSTLKFLTGAPGNQRQVSIVLGKNVHAGRLLLGFTISEPGNWTSWPPHEHALTLEEMYVCFDMPEPAFGIQMVYNETQYPELVTVVRDGDAVLIPSGYQPNTSVPGHRISFLWALAAHREIEDRQYGVVNVWPEFAAGLPSPR